MDRITRVLLDNCNNKYKRREWISYRRHEFYGFALWCVWAFLGEIWFQVCVCSCFEVFGGSYFCDCKGSWLLLVLLHAGFPVIWVGVLRDSCREVGFAISEGLAILKLCYWCRGTSEWGFSNGVLVCFGSSGLTYGVHVIGVLGRSHRFWVCMRGVDVLRGRLNFYYVIVGWGT